MSPAKRPIPERPCRAADPDVCPHHGFAAKFADLDRVAEKPARRRPKPHPILTDVEPVERALQAPARWEGATPAWWSKFDADAQEYDSTNQPELLDVLDTPIGEVGVVWLQNSPTRNDKDTVERDGMRVNFLALYHPATEEFVGYMKATFVDDETFSAAFGDDELTPYRYARRYRGGFYAELPEEAEWKTLTDEEKLPLLQEAWRYGLRDSRTYIETADGSLRNYMDVTQEDAPKTLEGIRASMAENLLPFYNKEVSWHRKYYSLSYIDYSSVEKPLQGKGYGSALYIYTARRLAEEGKVLRGSGVQTDKAQKVWQRLQARFPDQVSTMTLPSQERQSTEHHIFDLR